MMVARVVQVRLAQPVRLQAQRVMAARLGKQAQLELMGLRVILALQAMLVPQV